MKTFQITVNSRLELYQAYIASVNWMLGKNSLSNSEIEILSYFLYYNDKYKNIKESEIRFELLFSNSVKKKIRTEFNLSSQKMETYLNKLRKKGVILKNSINSLFDININDVMNLSYIIKLGPQVSVPHYDIDGNDVEENFDESETEYEEDEEDDEYYEENEIEEDWD